MRSVANRCASGLSMLIPAVSVADRADLIRTAAQPLFLVENTGEKVMRTEDMTVGQIQAGETGAGGFPYKTVKFSASVNLASVAAAVSAEQNVTITGIKSGDIPIHLDSAAGAATLGVYPQRCGADNTLTVRCTNTTAGAIDLGALTMTVTCLRPVTRL